MAELRPDNKVWKVGSRWSYDGNAGSCILDLFRKHHVVFVGHEHVRFSNIREGDLIAVSSGKEVVALGRAMEDPKPFSETGVLFSEDDSANVDPDEIGLACRISYHDLKEDDFVGYRIGAFHAVDQRADQFRALFRSSQADKRGDEFSIKARSCTLLHNSTSPRDVLLIPSNHFHIPIFQRAYSWGDLEVRRILNDLLNAFEGRLGRAKREPMFVGTMQFSAPKIVAEAGVTHRYDIIDGQQRMTTIALILRALQLLEGSQSCDAITWLSTSIGGATQQGYLTKALTDASPETCQDSRNTYLENLKLILNFLRDDEALETAEHYRAFQDYLTSRVFFVVIETSAGLSKTLQIFDSINTAGMDLNGGDVFKIRYFEYLREHEQEPEAVFELVAGLYTKIDQRNQSDGQFLRMEDILNSAKWIVCENLQLPYQARELVGTTFFDRLFDTVLKIEAWDGFSREKCSKVELPIALIDGVIDAAFLWQRMYPALRPEAMAMDTFIRWSRYGNYHDPFVVLFVLNLQPTPSELEEFLIALGKVLLIYSVRNQKKTYEGRGIMHTLLGKICDKSATDSSLLSEMRDISRENRAELKHCLTHDRIAYIPKSKDLLCRLIALLDELELNPASSEELCNLLFWDQEIDIEHIEAANHQDGTQRTEIQETWGQELHGLGNLTVLERDLNRSISNAPYSSHKRERYRASRFRVVRQFAEKHPEWTLELAQKRKTDLTDRLIEFLCGPTPLSPEPQPV